MSIYKLKQVSDPDISVVIPTLPENTLHCRYPLENQTEESFEVVVVEDETLDICEARNRGIEATLSEFILLTDDDCYPPEDWVEQGLSSLRTGKFDLIEGPVDVVDFPARMYPGCNLGFTKQAWERVGGFDSEFAGWNDDVAFGWAVESEFGLDRCFYDKTWLMYHLGPFNSEIIHDNDRLLRQSYPDRYFSIKRRPRSLQGKTFIYVMSIVYPYFPGFVDEMFALLD